MTTNDSGSGASVSRSTERESLLAAPRLEVLREKAGDGSTDFYVEVCQSDLAALIAERDGLLSQRWSHQNRAEVAERGHRASQARDFEQRDRIKSLRTAIEHVVNDSPGTPETVKGYLRKALRV